MLLSIIILLMILFSTLITCDCSLLLTFVSNYDFAITQVFPVFAITHGLKFMVISFERSVLEVMFEPLFYVYIGITLSDYKVAQLSCEINTQYCTK